MDLRGKEPFETGERRRNGEIRHKWPDRKARHPLPASGQCRPKSPPRGVPGTLAADGVPPPPRL